MTDKEKIKAEIERLRKNLPWGGSAAQLSMECNCKNEAKANGYTSDIEDYEQMFPELKESDDNRIRKELINVLSNREKYIIDQSFGDITVSEAIAWLEKQGDKMSDPRYHYLDALIDADDIYQMSMNDEMIKEAKKKAINALSKLEISKALSL